MSPDNRLTGKNLVDIGMLTKENLAVVAKGTAKESGEITPAREDNEYGYYYVYSVRVSHMGRKVILVLAADASSLDTQLAALNDVSSVLSQAAVTNDGFMFAVNKSDNSFLSKARLISYIIEEDPSVLNNASGRYYSEYDEKGNRRFLTDDEGNRLKSVGASERLQELCDANNIDSVYVFDEDGHTIATNTANWFFVISHNEEDQSYPFNKVLDGSVDYYVQDRMQNDLGEENQYIGVTFNYYTKKNASGDTEYVPLRDYLQAGGDKKALDGKAEGGITAHKGMLQIGLDSELTKTIMASTDVSAVLSSDMLGNGFSRINGIHYLQYYHYNDGYYVGAAVPKADMYNARTVIALITSLASLVLILILLLTVTLTTAIGVSLCRIPVRIISSMLGTRSETIGHLLLSVLKYGGAIGVFFYCLYLIGVDSTSLLASAGILSLVIGLGAQSLIKDILAGIFIVFEGEFRVGDIVTIDGYRGKVMDIGLRTTKIMGIDGNIKIYNNSEISGVLNMTQATSFAMCQINIEYGQDIEYVEEVLNIFYKNGIKVPFPHVTVMHKEEV